MKGRAKRGSTKAVVEGWDLSTSKFGIAFSLSVRGFVVCKILAVACHWSASPALVGRFYPNANPLWDARRADSLLIPSMIIQSMLC